MWKSSTFLSVKREYICNHGNYGSGPHKSSPFQINEKCPGSAKVISPGEMSSFGSQGAKMPLGVAMGYNFIKIFAEQMGRS